MVGLWDRRDVEVLTFSGGMRRRLEIARGLMHSPRVLFLDEPTIGLDPQTRASIWGYIHELREREEITIFMTTHYMDEAEFCDRIAIMDEGEIVALDTPAALKAQVGRGSDPDRDRRRRRGDRRAGRALRPRGDASPRAWSRSTSRTGRSSCRGCSPSSTCRSRRSASRGRPSTTSSCPSPARRSATPRRPRRTPQPHDDADDGGRADERHAEVVRVRVPPRSYRNELRAIKIVWTRELIRFRKDRMRIVTSLIQPLLFLFVLGSGLSHRPARTAST